ncbi:regulatory protein GemA [Rhodovulum sp. DZ06]|uniref:regulatory protein GemA n=1 Tax=Rhodovulum sp. DZ06 TaxID=3425126 RepID=UPI003D3496E0
MTITNKQKALLHVAKAKLGLDEDVYRLALFRLAGVTSSTELDQDGFDAVMGFFERNGFEPTRRTGPDYGDRPGFASRAQCELIRALWAEWSGRPDGAGLEAWLRRCFKVDSLRFLTAAEAPRAITALKAMKRRLRAAAAG